MKEELILLNDFSENSGADLDFLLLLESEGLIEMAVYENRRYIPVSQLSELETFVRLHYDLAVNVEGIDVIRNLLQRMRTMERELAVLRRQFDDDPFSQIDFLDEI